MRKKSVLAGIGILFAVLLTFIWGTPCVLEEIEAAQLPRASQKTFQMNPLASCDFSADVEAYRKPAITKTNHMLKVEYMSGEVRSTYYTDEKQEAFTFSRTAESEYTGELLVMRFEIKENLSESELKQGDTLWLATFETDAVKLFEKTKTVYLPLPVRRLNRDDVMPIDGTTYYCFPSEYDLFFVLNGKVFRIETSHTKNSSKQHRPICLKAMETHTENIAGWKPGNSNRRFDRNLTLRSKRPALE